MPQQKSVTVHGVYNALQCLPPRLKSKDLLLLESH
jgi:hypothetical protein